MRLYNEEEEKSKIIDVENYDTFKAAARHPLLPFIVFVYTGFAVINLVLFVLGGAYVMAGINLVIHSLVAVSLWLFYMDTKKAEQLSTKGIKMFQVAHAVKYFIVFVLLLVGLILIILDWINKGNLAHQTLDAANKQTNEQVLANAKHESSVVFWTHLLTLFVALVLTIVIDVYYYAVMKLVDGYHKYATKGIKSFGDYKFFAVYSFVCAGFLIVYSVLRMAGIDLIKVSLAKSELFVGYDLFCNIGRIVFALVLIFFGVVILFVYKKIKDVPSTEKHFLDLETGESHLATVEELVEALEREQALQQQDEEQEEEEESFVSKDLIYDEETIKNN